MGYTTLLVIEQIVGHSAQYAGIAIIGLAVLSMLSWCLAAGIMPRGHAANSEQQGR